ncbi:MAG: 4-hydroxy-tetrahydrodipicolinate reductase [Flavobacteriia bacterium]|nr:4-hydroxy-tetrahydrodipicolinate reductase [Flavobacteriia bacterium]
MKIALIGYGKMGKAIEEIAIERGHEIVIKCNSQNDITSFDLSNIDVAIEFTKPALAIHHINYCLDNHIPIVVGTTGWNEHIPTIESKAIALNGSILHASNFSIGVNLFFELNKKLAKLMSGNIEYSASLEEIHHLQKLDSPSGTAITLANGILENNSDYISWAHGKEIAPYTNFGQLPLVSFRQPDVPGTHTIKYSSDVDTITITHEAHNRKGFALGAVIAAEWLQNKKGVYSMKDVLNFK